MSDFKKTEDEVLRVYQKVNPSTYQIEASEQEFLKREQFLNNLFLYRLNFPPKLFDKSELLEFGAGTGEHSLFYLKWGCKGTFVEVNPQAVQRAEALFKHFGVTDYRFVNTSLFDFHSDKQYDIVLSTGVIHHTASPEQAYRIKARYVKPGGFVVLGVGNNAGFFQRNLQRTLLYSLANSEEQLVELANELFAEHLDRAEKFGRRSRLAIIHDSYINPKIDTPGVADILSWMESCELRFYSSWPNIVPALLGDPADRAPIRHVQLQHLLSLPETVFMTHADDDMQSLQALDKQAAPFVDAFREVVAALNDVSGEKVPDLEVVAKRITALENLQFRMNPYEMHLNAARGLLGEVKAVIALIQDNNIAEIKEFLKQAKYLFKGTSGLGMTWFVAHKPAVRE